MITVATPLSAARGSRTGEDLRLLQLLCSRRHRLEAGIGGEWNAAVSLELDLIIALEERVLSGAAERAGLRVQPEGGRHR